MVEFNFVATQTPVIYVRSLIVAEIQDESSVELVVLDAV